MGRKAKMGRLMRKIKEEAAFEKVHDDHEAGPSNQSAKTLSKKHKKNKRNIKKHQVTITKEHKWYQIKVTDKVAPTKEFLMESFRSFLDTEITMLGFHKSTISSRFFLEDNGSAAIALAALHKRMMGVPDDKGDGKLMHIMAEPCKQFLLLNAYQLAVVKRVLENRFDAPNEILDLKNFHNDPVFLEHDILPVLSDIVILKQIVMLLKNNVRSLKGLVMSNNALRLTHVKVLMAALGDYHIKRLNLEHNDIENVRDLVITLSKLSLVELKLEGNNCLRDIKDPNVYIKTVRSKIETLQLLDGVDIDGFLNQSTASIATETPVKVEPNTQLLEQKFLKFLEQFYVCLDNSESRAMLLQAYLPDANFAIESQVAFVPSGECVGHDKIKEALALLPGSVHATETFNLETVKCDETIGQFKVSGQVKVLDHVCSFVHAFTIVPYNNGLGCAMSVLGYR